MEVKLVKYKNGYIGISDERKYLKFGYGYLDDKIYLLKEGDGGVLYKILFISKELYIENIPLIDLSKYSDNPFSHEIKFEGYNGHLNSVHRRYYVSGYNKCKEIYQFSKEDLRKALELSKEIDSIEDIIEKMSNNKIISVDVKSIGDEILTETIDNNEYVVIDKVNFYI
jgi:hypothetical protein